jgi:hypothetical protein
MSSILLLGFLIGVQHALEADHVAAVATLASQSPSARRTLGLGAAWGLGHSVPLFLLGAVVLLTDLALPAALGRWLDIGVGLMLVVLGADLLVRLARRRIHVHPHRHGDGLMHVHAHSHVGETAHSSLHHEHRHGRALTLKAVLVGMVHGLAGSGSLILLTLETLHSVAWGLVYIAVFALGPLAGMALLTAVISLPLRFAAQRLTLVHAGLQGVIGLATMTIGVTLALPLFWH